MSDELWRRIVDMLMFIYQASIFCLYTSIALLPFVLNEDEDKDDK